MNSFVDKMHVGAAVLTIDKIEIRRGPAGSPEHRWIATSGIDNGAGLTLGDALSRLVEHIWSRNAARKT